MMKIAMVGDWDTWMWEKSRHATNLGTDPCAIGPFVVVPDYFDDEVCVQVRDRGVCYAREYEWDGEEHRVFPRDTEDRAWAASD